MPQMPYPPAETFVDYSAAFSPAILTAVHDYARSKPWRGTRVDQLEKLQAFHDALVAAGEVTSDLSDTPAPDHLTGQGLALCGYDSETDTVHVAERVSVVSYLYAIAAQIVGESHANRMRFAVNLFRVGFPRSFARADLSGPGILLRG